MLRNKMKVKLPSNVKNSLNGKTACITVSGLMFETEIMTTDNYSSSVLLIAIRFPL